MAREIENALNSIIKPNVERTLLSICLQRPEEIISIKENDVTGNMFLIPANQYIFYAADYLFSKQQSPTPLAVMEVLKDKAAKKEVEDFGGVEYLTLLTEQRINTDNVNIFCQKLKQAYTRKELCEICEKSKEFAISDKVEVLNPSEILAEVEGQLTDLAARVQQTKEVYKIGDGVEEVLALRAESPSAVPGLEVGWPKLDYYTNGGQPGDLIMVCARAKTGKSTILTNWATKLAIDDKVPLLYFDTEMNARQQEDRILSILSGVPNKEIVSGMYVLDTENGTAKEKCEALASAIKRMKDGKYFHIYLPNFTIEKVSAISKKFKAQHDIQAIFFDYLKFPSSQIKSLRSVQEWQMLGYIASGLKDLAGILNMPIYSACQENRSDPKGERKDERNVGGSDRILQFASKLMFLANKSEEDIIKEGEINGNQRLYIAYQRNGESDCPPINIRFDRQRLTQAEV